MTDITQEALARQKKEIEEYFKRFEMLVKRFDETEQKMVKQIAYFRQYDKEVKRLERQIAIMLGRYNDTRQ